MANQTPFSNASGEVIIKGILRRLNIKIPDLERETGLSYSSLQRIFNGETKKLSVPVVEALKARWPQLNDEYLRNAILPVFITDDEDLDVQEDDVDIVGILTSAREILRIVESKELEIRARLEKMDSIEQSLSERAKALDERARQLDQIMHMIVARQVELSEAIKDIQNEQK